MTTRMTFLASCTTLLTSSCQVFGSPACNDLSMNSNCILFDHELGQFIGFRNADTKAEVRFGGQIGGVVIQFLAMSADGRALLFYKESPDLKERSLIIVELTSQKVKSVPTRLHSIKSAAFSHFEGDVLAISASSDKPYPRDGPQDFYLFRSKMNDNQDVSIVAENVPASCRLKMISEGRWGYLSNGRLIGELSTQQGLKSFTSAKDWAIDSEAQCYSIVDDSDTLTVVNIMSGREQTIATNVLGCGSWAVGSQYLLFVQRPSKTSTVFMPNMVKLYNFKDGTMCDLAQIRGGNGSERFFIVQASLDSVVNCFSTIDLKR